MRNMTINGGAILEIKGAGFELSSSLVSVELDSGDELIEGEGVPSDDGVGDSP